MSIQKLYKKMARLESMNDQLEMELQEIDDLLRQVGFPNGLQSAKAIAMELVEENNETNENSNEISEIPHHLPTEDQRFSSEERNYEEN